MSVITRKRRAVITLFAAVLAAGALSGPAAGTADAWYGGNVWVGFGGWNCPGGGVVKGIYWANDYYSVGPAYGDWGDDLIYPAVRIGWQNTISYQLFCRTWYGYQYKGAVGQRQITPGYNGQSFRF
jgi:hypothetical protein